jgi:hypothetical protein
MKTVSTTGDGVAKLADAIAERKAAAGATAMA